jgi:hypothetical protein
MNWKEFFELQVLNGNSRILCNRDIYNITNALFDSKEATCTALIEIGVLMFLLKVSRIPLRSMSSDER